MSDTNSTDDCYEAVLREHTTLRCLLDELNKMLFERIEPFSVLSSRMVELQQLVDKHFRTEEESGCFNDLVAHAPRVSEKVGALMVEHQDLSLFVGQIVSRVLMCQGQPEDWESVHAEFGEFMVRLTQHETLENELLQEVFTEDIGSKD